MLTSQTYHEKQGYRLPTLLNPEEQVQTPCPTQASSCLCRCTQQHEGPQLCTPALLLGPDGGGRVALRHQRLAEHVQVVVGGRLQVVAVPEQRRCICKEDGAIVSTVAG